MKVERLRINGFKSFADPVEISFLDGITGIVGPNGCGKSNVVESIKWAMGETSAKKIRGDGMDDIIFNGTDLRPAKNSCEVTILARGQDDSDPELKISRQISRGDGSTYKINGKTVKAKDVQILFKDAGLGSSTSAIVSQGKITSIVNGKPLDRKNILEEAAGISGLLTRKHEAEIRLRGTEENLERAELLEKGLTDQLSSLRKQARQAKKKKEIDHQIDTIQANIFYIRHEEINSAIIRTTTDLTEIEAYLKEHMWRLATIQNLYSADEAKAKPLLDEKTKAETEFALARAKAEGLKKEISNLKASIKTLEKSIRKSQSEIEKSEEEQAFLTEEIFRVTDELSAIEDDANYDNELVALVNEELDEKRADLERSTAHLNELSNFYNQALSKHNTLDASIKSANLRAEKLSARIRDLTVKTQEARISLDNLPEVSELSALEDTLVIVTTSLEEIFANKLKTTEDYEISVQALSSLTNRLKLAESELTEISRRQHTDAVLNRCRVDVGYEQALSAALGQALFASTNPTEAGYWAGSNIACAPHRGTEPLGLHVEAPDELKSIISAIGIAASRETADEFMETMTPGQIIVTTDGYAVRWDGYKTSAQATEAQAVLDQQRAATLSSEIIALNQKLHTDTTAQLKQALIDITAQEANLRQQRLSLESEIKIVRQQNERAISERSRLSNLILSYEQSSSELAIQVEDEIDGVEILKQEKEQLDSLNYAEDNLNACRIAQAEKQSEYEAARNRLDKAKRDADTRNLQVNSFKRQIGDLQRQLKNCQGTISENKRSIEEATIELTALSDNPILYDDAEKTAIDAVQEKLDILLSYQEKTKSLEDNLSKLKTETETLRTLIQDKKEERASRQMEFKSNHTLQDALLKEIEDRLRCTPADLVGLYTIEPNSDSTSLDILTQKLDRLIRERDSIGYVNLLAEQQLDDAQGKYSETQKQREELKTAVKEIRENIEKLNEECRERLTSTFFQVDQNFQNLFKKVFNGGEAYLKLSGSDDVLLAGLEIYASPPGKKMQTMSLLSGGEQSLISVCLIFATFLTRPAPICILDEVDAYFDDANVARMCNLITDLSKGETRFIVVTHHALTMAKCDRLIGVTMAEKGVSKIVSLDIDQAISYIELNSSIQKK